MSNLWFRIPSGPQEGRVHLRGWLMTAIGDPNHVSGLIAVGNCPRCFATVIADPDHTYGDLTWKHEQWHAETDYPIPDGI